MKGLCRATNHSIRTFSGPIRAYSSRRCTQSPQLHMNLDIAKLLADWPYEPGQINVRLIEGDEGVPLIQVRLDLGLLQMHVEGRPDGQEPLGYGSFLEYQEARQEGAELRPDGDDDAEFTLDEDDCRHLREEAVQYYHRYIALLVLEDFEGVLRDTSRNLRLLDLCAAHAETEQDRSMLEQFRPYILMMRTRALTSLAMKKNENKLANFEIEQGLERIRRHFEQIGRPELFEESGEAQMLRGMREALVPRLPVSQAAELRQRLKEALERENYELAAILRDELRMMGEVGD